MSSPSNPPLTRFFPYLTGRDGSPARNPMLRCRKIAALRRVGEDVATLTPHGPGRAEFPHPVLHKRVWLTAT